MPNYPGAVAATVPVASNISPINLEKGQSVFVFGQLKSGATQLPVNDTNVDFEAASANATQASIAVCLVGAFEGAPAPFVRVEILTNGDPGASESIAVQEADTDADKFYITPSAAPYTVAVTSTGVASSDLSPTGGKFMRVVRTKGANAVSCRVKLTRLA